MSSIKVSWIHVNNSKVLADGKRTLSKKEKKSSRSKTMCIIEDSEGNLLAEGLAVCSLQDNFCKKTGRRVSFNRAIKNLPAPELKELAWDTVKDLVN